MNRVGTFFLTLLVVFGLFTSRFNIANAQVSDAPVLNSATAGNASVVLNWSAPVNIGGSAIANYRISIIPDRGVEYFQSVTNPADRSATVSGLTNGTLYTFKIQARNSSGYSAFSNALTATPAAPNTDAPDAPTLTSATAGDGQIVVNWTAPAYVGGGEIIRYDVSVTPQGGSESVTQVGAVTTTTITGLTNNTEYSVKVRAENIHGRGAYSNTLTATPVPYVAPALVGTPSVSAGNTSATITWTTNVDMSSWITFGLTSATSVTTSEINTETRTTTHSVTISNLVACTQYRYRINSKDAEDTLVQGDIQIFQTSGCPLNARMLSTEQRDVVVAEGGILDLRDTEIKTQFNIPSEVTCLCSDIVIQAIKLEKESITSGINTPDRKRWLADHVYKFNAYRDEEEIIEEFDLPIEVTIEYTEEDVSGIDLNTLGIYHYNENTDQWNVLNECNNSYNSQTRTGQITCKTLEFSTFVLAELTPEEMPKKTWGGRLKSFWTKMFRPYPLKKFDRCDAVCDAI